MTILSRIQGSAAVITLNRPHRYNATDYETVFKISEFLNEIRHNPMVYRVIITSDHPKAFCAGGDILIAYEAMKNKDFAHGAKFFESEYKLVYDLATFEKPVISLVNGLCFGGGMGLSMHNKFRILSNNAILGMPETIIGFFPDVGASFRFAKFPRAWANFYGLTGRNIAIGHALQWDMADFFVPAQLLPELLVALSQSSHGNDATIIKQFACLEPADAVFGESFVPTIFNKSLVEIFEALKNLKNDEAQEVLNDLQSRSPLSLYIVIKLFEMAVYLDLKKSLILDEVIAHNFMHNPDFMEGIRAQVVDKDRQPKWKYRQEEITEEMVRDFFVPFFS